MDNMYLLAGIVFFILLEGFFTGSEMALISSDPILLHRLKRKKKLGANEALYLISSPERLFFITLLGTDLSVVASSFLFNRFCQSIKMPYPTISTLFIVPFILVFGEIIPKTIGSKSPARIALFSSLPFSFLFRTLKPAIAIFTILTKKMGIVKKSPLISKGELYSLISYSGSTKGKKRSLLRKALQIIETPITSTPFISKIPFIVSGDKKVSDAVKRLDTGVDFLFIGSGSLHNITGIIPITLLASANSEAKLSSIAMEPYVIGSDKRCVDILSYLQNNNSEICFIEKDNKILGSINLYDIISSVSI